MKKLIVLIALILPTLIFSQDKTDQIDLFEPLVWEMIIGVDTVTVLRKDHAKTLARERVNYWFLQKEIVSKDSIASVWKQLGEGMQRENELWEALANSKDDKIDLHEKYEESQGKTVSILEQELKTAKKTSFILILLSITATIIALIK